LLATTAGADTLILALGRDKNVLVERTLLKDLSSRSFLGNTKSVARSYETVVRNTRQQPIDLVVKDQYPISGDKRIEVEQLNHSGAQVAADTGLVTWSIRLQPASTEKRTLSYRIKYPRQMRLPVD
jgi:hypothetical protein